MQSKMREWQFDNMKRNTKPGKKDHVGGKSTLTKVLYQRFP